MVVDRKGTCDNCGCYAVAKFDRCPDCGESTSADAPGQAAVDPDARQHVVELTAAFKRDRDDWRTRYGHLIASFWLDHEQKLVEGEFAKWNQTLSKYRGILEGLIDERKGEIASNAAAYRRYTVDLSAMLSSEQVAVGGQRQRVQLAMEKKPQLRSDWLRGIRLEVAEWLEAIDKATSLSQLAEPWDVKSVQSRLELLHAIGKSVAGRRRERALGDNVPLLALEFRTVAFRLNRVEAHLKRAKSAVERELAKRAAERQSRTDFAEKVSRELGLSAGDLPSLNQISELLKRWAGKYDEADLSWRSIVPSWVVANERLQITKSMVLWFESEKDWGERPQSRSTDIRGSEAYASILTLLRDEEVYVRSSSRLLIEAFDVFWLSGTADLLVQVGPGAAVVRTDASRALYFNVKHEEWMTSEDRTIGRLLDPVPQSRIRKAAQSVLVHILDRALSAKPAVKVSAHKQQFHRALSIDQRAAINLISSGAPLVFISGAGGTGKSHLTHKALASQRALVVAPTGLSALAVDGTTIHRLFRLPSELATEKQFKPFNRTDISVLEKCERLIIDEISMVRADVLDHVDTRLRSVRNPRVPFGGLPVVLVGDPFQLPPVLKHWDKGIFKDHLGYNSPYFFGSRVIRDLYERVDTRWHAELTTQHRLASDVSYAALLGHLRIGNFGKHDIATLNERVISRRAVSSSAVFLCARNKEAENINKEKLRSLKGPTGVFMASGAWPIAEKPAEDELVLKRGARVVFLKNHPEGKWVNGHRGRVVGWSEIGIDVELDEGPVVSVDKERWELREPYIDPETGELSSRVVGSFVQFPLRLCWAISIHKAQGMTLSDVAIDLGAGSFAEGQTYVALSRVRRLSDLVLLKPLYPKDIRIAQEVACFMGITSSRS